MSTLIVEPLFSGVTFTQNIKVDRSVSVAHIRPWVYIHNTLVDGDFQCRVLQGASELAVATINFADINLAKTETYAHGFIRFDFESLILHRAEGEENTDYIFEFSMINHTSNPTNYIGVVREWDLLSTIIYGDLNIAGDGPINSMVAPVGYDIFEYRS